MRLNDVQIQRLEELFHSGAGRASNAMAKWLSVPSLITIESVDQLEDDAATRILGGAEEILCFCIMGFHGNLSGHLILCFDDESGLSLTDLLLDQSAGTAKEWGEVEKSAALESHNIIGSAYLNALAESMSTNSDSDLELVPLPPQFRRDFVASLLQSVFMDQILSGDLIFVAKARFELRGIHLRWTLLFVPDGDSMKSLGEILAKAELGKKAEG